MTTTIDTTQNIKSMARDAKGHLLKKVTDTPMLAILDAANLALRAIRTKHPEVPNAILVIGTSSTKKYGHFAPASWDSKGAQNEIMLSGESLKRGAEDVLGTLIHECAHALASARQVKDVSRQGRFHNTRFKGLAEELGIDVEHDKTIGWSITSLPKETANLYKTEIAALRKALKSYRIPTVTKVTVKTTTKVECECRSITLSNKFLEKGLVRCEACHGVMVPVDNDDDEGWEEENEVEENEKFPYECPECGDRHDGTDTGTELCRNCQEDDNE